MSSKPVRVGIAGVDEFDPLDIYYTHSKIRPFFSGCGKRIVDTIAEIESGKITAHDIPQISVIQDNQGNAYCLNNRRLYVFKHIRRLGLLENNKIAVRVKKGIPRELAKYTPEKCSLNCVIIREKAAIELDKKESAEQEESHEIENAPDEENGILSTHNSDNNMGEVHKAGGVSLKNDKKKLQVAHDETDEERYARKAQKIAEMKILYEKQAAERLAKKKEKEDLLMVADSDTVDDDIEEEQQEEDQQDIFICDLCSKEFKSVEQIEQHFGSKAHKKLVQLEYKKKKERERKAARRTMAKEKKLAKANSSSHEGSYDDTNTSLSSIPEPPSISLENQVFDTMNGQDETVEVRSDDNFHANSRDSSDDSHDEDDDDLMLLQMVSNSKRMQLGLPDMDSESDSDQ